MTNRYREAQHWNRRHRDARRRLRCTLGARGPHWRGDVGIITESLWRLADSEQSESPKLIWISPAFSHCVFTATKDFDESRAKRFVELLTAMKPTEADCADIRRLEGTKKWRPGSPEGLEDLIGALSTK